MRFINLIKKSVYMLIRTSLLLLVSLAAARDVAAQASSLWIPKPCPTHCKNPNAELLLPDVSLSMKTNRLFDRAIKEIERYIDEASPCSYIILGRFGTTADVVDDDYLTTPQAREHLKHSARGLSATHSSTNFDEAAKLIEWVQYKLQAAATKPMRLSVVVLTDENSSPDPEKQRFSLREYFKQHLLGSDLSITEVALATLGEVQPVKRIDGYTTVTISVGELKKFLQEASKLGAKPTAETTIPSQEMGSSNGTTGSVTTSGSTVSPALRNWILGICGLILMGVLAFSIVHRKRRSYAAERGELMTEAQRTLPDEPVALLITERQKADGVANARRVIFRKDERVLIAPNVPVTFGTNDAQHRGCCPT